MSIPKCLDFTDYSHYVGDENPTTNAQMQEFMTNQNELVKQLANMVWQPQTPYFAGQVIRSSNMPSGTQAIVTTAGVTGSSEPQWDVVGNYVQDGGVIYIMRSITVVDLIYPIGSIYMSTVRTNPNVLFGIGEWERIGDGRCLIDCGNNYEAGSEGGSADAIVPYHTHTFTGNAVNTGNNSVGHTHSGTTGNVSQGHTHSVTGYGYGDLSRWGNGGEKNRGTITTGAQSANHTHSFTTGAQSANHTHSVTASGTNSYAGTSGNTVGANMPPYLAVYMWKRVA